MQKMHTVFSIESYGVSRHLFSLYTFDLSLCVMLLFFTRVLTDVFLCKMLDPFSLRFCAVTMNINRS